MLKYLAAVSLLAICTVYVTVQDEQHAKDATSEPTKPDNKIVESVGGATADENHAPQNANESKRHSPSWFRFFRWPEGTGAWAILFTLLAIVEQTRETRRATDSQRDKDRARLIVVGLRDDESLGMATDMGESYWAIAIVLRQQGPSKAFNVRGRATVLVKPASEKRPTMRPKEMVPLDDIPTIVEGEPAAIDGNIGFTAIKDADMMKINTGELRVHFFGLVEYEDVFRATHTTRFRYVWQPEERAEVPGEPGETFQVTAEGWQVCGRKKDNHAD